MGLLGEIDVMLMPELGVGDGLGVGVGVGVGVLDPPPHEANKTDANVVAP